MKDFVAQCGDPTGTGSGGPGYAIGDEFPRTGSYVRGVIAMANAGPNTDRQPVLRDAWRSTTSASVLDLWKVVGGDTTLNTLNAVGHPTEGAPSKPVTVERVTIREVG